jgi:hypothetical protein
MFDRCWIVVQAAPAADGGAEAELRPMGMSTRARGRASEGKRLIEKTKYQKKKKKTGGIRNT